VSPGSRVMQLSEEIRLDTPRGRMAGLSYPERTGPPVICLHGWLDNAASFVPLSRLLSGLDLVALDFPGHGRSDHRRPGANYYFMEYLFDLDAALDALGWESCHIVGHSMGAAVGSLYASAEPGRVRSLCMLDAVGPVTEPVEKCPGRLQRSLRSMRDEPRRRKAYASIEEMMRARQANSDLHDESARLICERSATKLDSHYEWSNDPALHWVSPVVLAEEQALEYLRQIEAPVMTLTATPFAHYVGEEKTRARTAAIAHGRHHLVEGDHHFHMDKPEMVAGVLQAFIGDQEQGITK